MTKLASTFNLARAVLSHFVPKRPTIQMNECPENKKVLSIHFSNKNGTFEITPDFRVVKLDTQSGQKRPMFRRFENRVRESLAKALVKQGVSFPKGFEFLERDYDYSSPRLRR